MLIIKDKTLKEIVEQLVEMLPNEEAIIDLSYTPICQVWGLTEREVYSHFTKKGGQRLWVWRTICDALGVNPRKGDWIYYNYKKMKLEEY